MAQRDDVEVPNLDDADVDAVAMGCVSRDRLTFPVAGSKHGRSLLPVDPVEAQVLTVDDGGRPALVERAVGDGAILLATYPLEYLASAAPRVNPTDIARLYRALAVRAGTLPDVHVDRADVHVDRLVRDDGQTFVWLLSHADDAVTVAPTLPANAVLLDLAADEPVDRVALPPGGVRVLRLRSGYHPGAAAAR